MVATPDVDSRPSQVLSAAKPLKAAGMRLEPTASTSEACGTQRQGVSTHTKVRGYSYSRAAEGKQGALP